MSSNIPTIDSEEYRIVKENTIASLLAVRREIRDKVDIQYYNDYCDKLKDTDFKYKPINAIRILVAELENLRDNVDEKNVLNNLIHCQCLKTFTLVAKSVEKLGADIDSLKQRQNQEYYDMRRYLLLIFMIVIPLFPFFKK